MRRHTNILGIWVRNGTGYAGATKTDDGSRLRGNDRILQRLAWISQIVLVVAAIVGYVLTVRPIYQKQLLDEQIAERTVKLREATAALKTFEEQSAKLKTENVALLAEANTSYNRLRSNLKAEFSTIATTCGYQDNVDALNGPKLFDCVVRWANRDIIAHLRPADRKNLVAALDAQRDTIAKLLEKAAVARTEKLRKIRQRYARYDAMAKKLEREIITEISSLRSKQGTQAAPLKTLDDLKELRTREEEIVYDRLFPKYVEAMNSLSDARFDKIFADRDVRSDVSSALGDVLQKVAAVLGR